MPQTCALTQQTTSSYSQAENKPDRHVYPVTSQTWLLCGYFAFSLHVDSTSSWVRLDSLSWQPVAPYTRHQLLKVGVFSWFWNAWDNGKGFSGWLIDWGRSRGFLFDWWQTGIRMAGPLGFEPRPSGPAGRCHDPSACKISSDTGFSHCTRRRARIRRIQHQNNKDFGTNGMEKQLATQRNTNTSGTTTFPSKQTA